MRSDKTVTEALWVIFDRGTKEDDLAIAVGEWLEFIAESGRYAPPPQAITDAKFIRAAGTLEKHVRESGAPRILSDWFRDVSALRREREAAIRSHKNASSRDDFTITSVMDGAELRAEFIGSVSTDGGTPVPDDPEFADIMAPEPGKRLMRALATGDADAARGVISGSGYGMGRDLSRTQVEALMGIADRPDAVPVIVSQAGQAMWSGCRAVVVRGIAYVHARGHVNLFGVSPVV